MSLPLFDHDAERPPLAARLAPTLRALADEGIYFGTSSWKYEGWLGQIYSSEKYLVRGRLSQKKFEAECLAEYAETFPAVCGDFSFYQFPSSDYWQRLFGETPASLQFAFKVPEELTVAIWPSHARYGPRAGQPNEHFLDAKLFERAFADLLAPYQDRIATLIFEFGTFNRKLFATPDHFFERLEGFLSALPGGYRYAVEIRNPEYLRPGYYALLSSHMTAHIFNAWTRMPTLADQVARPEAFTADFVVARALLRRGRSYEQAVRTFEPYEVAREPDAETRDALRQLAERARRVRQPCFLFVNNRLEGSAPQTIEAVALALREPSEA
jgi:uncharacterized protein YecE (DUF72 family)